MAEINVEKKSSFPWWIWIIVGLIVVGILFFLLGGDNQTTGTDTRDRDTRDTRDTVRRQGTTQLTPASEEMNISVIKEEHPNLILIPALA
jgi:hypothetical protein